MNGTKAGLDLDLDAIKAVPEVEHFEGGESWVHLSAWERDALVAEVERLRNENRVLRVDGHMVTDGTALQLIERALDAHGSLVAPNPPAGSWWRS